MSWEKVNLKVEEMGR